MMNNTFSSHDFYYSAYLVATKHPLIRVDRDPPPSTRSSFVFEDFPERAETMRTFLTGEPLVNARDYSLAIKTLKSAIYS